MADLSFSRDRPILSPTASNREENESSNAERKYDDEKGATVDPDTFADDIVMQRVYSCGRRPHSVSVSLPLANHANAPVYTFYIFNSGARDHQHHHHHQLCPNNDDGYEDKRRPRGAIEMGRSAAASTITLCSFVEKSTLFKCLGSLVKYKERVGMLIGITLLVAVPVGLIKYFLHA